MNKNISIVLAFLFFLSTPAALKGADKRDFIEKMEGGHINWSRAIILSKGIGEPRQHNRKAQAQAAALKTAKLDAKRKILGIILDIRIDATSTIRSITLKNDVIMAKIENMIKNAQVVKQKYMSDGTVAVTIEMSMIGGFAQLVLPREIKQVETVKPIAPNNKKEKRLSLPQKSVSRVYTGLVLDARGLKVRPAMVPKIRDERGQEVYGSAYVSREYAVQKGMSAYTRDLKAAKKNPRVIDNPLIVKGLRTMGSGKTDIVISNSDASRLRSDPKHLFFLKKCRVVIVADGF